MTRTADQRRKASRHSLLAWYGSVPPALFLSVMAAIEAWKSGEPWAAALLIFVTMVSVWTGIETAHARLNADLES